MYQSLYLIVMKLLSQLVYKEGGGEDILLTNKRPLFCPITFPSFFTSNAVNNTAVLKRR